MLANSANSCFNNCDTFLQLWAKPDYRSMRKYSTCQITFCLCPGYPLFCVASALEVLRHANRFCDVPYFFWTILCEDDKPLASSNGILMNPTCEIGSAPRSDFAVVVAGFEPIELDVPNIESWIRKAASAGSVIGGISNGGFVLAKTGLLKGYEATVHWEDFAAFSLTFPNVISRYQRYVVDRDRITCSGGTSTLDMFVEVVRDHLGSEISTKVSRQLLLQQYSGTAGDSEANSILNGSLHHSFRVQRALSLLDVSIDGNMSVSDLASRVGLSHRQLLRLFRREVGMTPSAVLAQRRLERARSLVLHSHLPLAAISSATGFSSQSHLTSAYKGHFGKTPAQHRRHHQIRHN